MPIMPRDGRARLTRHRKSWARSSGPGALKDVTLMPCGFTPVITCLMVESLPAASMAWNTSSSDQVEPA